MRGGELDAARPPEPSRLRRGLGFLLACAALASAAAAALATRPEVGGVNGVEQLSSASATFLSQAASVLPLGYAFGAGMVSAVNPCGFALLPTYLGIYLGNADSSPSSISVRLGRAVLVSLTVTASFVLLFALAGLVLSLVSSALGTYFPWIGLAVGIVLTGLGGALLGGAHLYSWLGQGLGDRVGPAARRGGIRGYAAYGVAYGACSLGCTLPIFLGVVATGLAAGGPVGAFRQFVLYALGMGFALTALTVATAVVKQTAFRPGHWIGTLLEPASAVLLLITGAYVVFYWLGIGGVLAAIGIGPK